MPALNDAGSLVGSADTVISDPHPSSCFNADCFVSHAFQWRDGVKTDIGALPGRNSSFAGSINANGLIGGMSQNGLIDAVTGIPEFVAVVWKHGEIIDLGTFGGAFSIAGGINVHDQVVGQAQNAVPDSFSLFGVGTQTRAFLWQDGVMRDLGTLGGPDALAFGVNDYGQIVGYSYLNSTPNPDTGIPTLHPFLWKDGQMHDLGTLGGTIGISNSLNNRGQVVGQMNLTGDVTTHPFLWDDGTLTDLGTLGGNNGLGNWINDSGEIVGRADLPGSQKHDAFLWKRGAMIDLGTVEGDLCSNALGINSHGQIVGGSSDCTNFLHAFVWDNGGPMLDLNTLVPTHAELTLIEAIYINDDGEIAGIGVPSGCSPLQPESCEHAFLLVPCDDDCEQGNAAVPDAQVAIMPAASNSGSSLSNPAAAHSRPMIVRGRFGKPYTLPPSKPHD